MPSFLQRGIVSKGSLAVVTDQRESTITHSPVDDAYETSGALQSVSLIVGSSLIGSELHCNNLRTNRAAPTLFNWRVVGVLLPDWR